MADIASGVETAKAVETVAHVVQVALTPVFLLSGIGTLLNVFNTRLARVSDHTTHLSELLDAVEDPDEHRRMRAHMRRLERRRVALDTSVVLAGLGCAAACGAILVLFVGGLREAEIANWLFAMFGVALVCTVGALAAFLLDGALAWHGLSREGPLPHGPRPP